MIDIVNYSMIIGFIGGVIGFFIGAVVGQRYERDWNTLKKKEMK